VTEKLEKWYSPNIGKDFETLVFGDKGIPILLFPTSMGRYNENKDFKLIESAQWYIDNGLVKIYCVDGVDSHSWYNKKIHPSERVKNHIWYDKMLHEELVPRMIAETGYSKIVTAGCSFGGYHATNYAFRHPEHVKYVLNMSAAFDIKSQLNGFYDDNVYFNNPADFIPNIEAENFQDLMVILGTAEFDSCLEPNIKMAEILAAKGIKNWLDIRKNAKHDWPIWREMFPHYLSLIKY
jgi:esterase/lipase superfamily enzyme